MNFKDSIWVNRHLDLGNNMTVKNLFIKLLKYKSVTPQDDGAFDFIAEHMSEFEVTRIDKNGTKNLFLYKKFGDGEHLCFAGHIDVVPPGDGWDSDPFIPIEKKWFYLCKRISGYEKRSLCNFTILQGDNSI